MSTFRDRFSRTEVRSIVPGWLSSYVFTHMNTTPKTVNHVLGAMAICNVFLFFSSFAAFWMPNMGFNTFLVTILSSLQSIIFFIILNGERVRVGGHLNISDRYSFLTPSSFNVGAMFGITVGMACMDFMISIYFGQLSRCQKVDVDIAQYACDFKGAMWSIWLFAGLLFWINVALAALLALGKDELTIGQSQYEDIGITMNDFDSETTGQPSGRAAPPTESGDSSFGARDLQRGHQATDPVYTQV